MPTKLGQNKDFKYSFPYKRIRIFPDRDLRATILEMIMIDTRIMQRLRNTKQLGLATVSYPTAEHSRFSHSLGVLYWSTKILSALNDNHNADENIDKLDDLNEAVKRYMHENIPDIKNKTFSDDKILGVTWFEQLVRLYALLHDITHIPFGHTIEDQACLFDRHDDDLPRLSLVFKMLREEIQNSYHLADSPHPNELLLIAEQYIELIHSMFIVGCVTNDTESESKSRKAWINTWNQIHDSIKRPLLLTFDIVSNTICADLMDYTLRDTLFSSMPKTFDKALLTCMKIVEHKTTFYLEEKKAVQMLRLGVSISRKKLRHDIITAILDLLRIRYDLTEKVYYHHTKVITDAMLEKILRSLPSNSKPLNFGPDEIKSLHFTPNDIYADYLGDEGFLSLIESRLKANPKLIDILEILHKMLRRNLYKAVFRINKNVPLSRIGKKNVLNCSTPLGRDKMESEIVLELTEKYNANFTDGDIIISYPPEKMQKKVAKALIEWPDGQIFPFESLPMEANYSNEVGILTERYQTLWSMTVFINPSKIQYIRLVESLCENKFETHNENILKNYLKEKYSEYYDSSKTMTEINHKVISIESNKILSKTAIGNNHLTPDDKNEIIEDAFTQAISDRKSSRKGKSKKPNRSATDDNPPINFGQ